MRIVLVVEGKTEKAFCPHLRDFLKPRLSGRMPHIAVHPCNGLIPTGSRLQRIVRHYLDTTANRADHVIALTDVYTGANPPEFTDAADAKSKMRNWVGAEPRFHPHAAQFDFEAWLLPYWETIKRLARHNQNPPGVHPEQVNHGTPPARHLQALFQQGRTPRNYSKPRDANRILRENDLMVSIQACSELKAFVNTILNVCGGTPIA